MLVESNSCVFNGLTLTATFKLLISPSPLSCFTVETLAMDWFFLSTKRLDGVSRETLVKHSGVTLEAVALISRFGVVVVELVVVLVGVLLVLKAEVVFGGRLIFGDGQNAEFFSFTLNTLLLAGVRLVDEGREKAMSKHFSMLSLSLNDFGLNGVVTLFWMDFGVVGWDDVGLSLLADSGVAREAISNV